MSTRTLLLCLALFVCIPGLAVSQEAEEGSGMDMMKLMEKWAKTDAHHEQLKWFVGDWETETRIVMPGMEGMPAEKGTARARLLLDGRFLSQEFSGKLFGKPLEGFFQMGFDRYKKKWVAVTGSTQATALYTMEGVVVDPTNKVITLYGTVDEYLTGEHDKPARYTIRRIDDDTFAYEVWDLGIGPYGAKVVEVTYRRVKEE